MGKGHRALIAAGISMIIAGGFGTFASGTKVKAATNPITFGVPSVVDPIHGVGEPDIAIDRAQHIFVSGPAGTGEQRSLWWSSVDGGQTYRVIEPIEKAVFPNAVSSTPNQPGGGDTDIAFDNRTPQKQYFSDLVALTSLREVVTSDEGATETQTQDNGTPGGVDRQWFAVYDPTGSSSGSCGVSTSPACASTTPIIYQEYNGVVWERSTDGQTYTSASPSSPFGPDGYPAIDQVTGKIFQANYSGGTIKVNIGTPYNTAGDLCFRDDSITTCPATAGAGAGLITAATGVGSTTDTANFVVTSIDSARNVYVSWVTQGSNRQAWVAAAPANNAVPVLGCSINCWNSWTSVQVSDGLASTGDKVNLFPWIKAGGPGKADAVWYGDSSSLAPATTCTPLSTGCHVWNVFMNQVVFPTDVTGAITGAAPSTNLVKVTPHPMDYFDVCLGGTGCVTSQGNRNLADFFEVNIDASGAAEVVYDDMSNNLIQAGTSNAIDHGGAPMPTVARQNGGPGLFGTNVTGASSAPISGLPDVTGDALYPVVGGPGNLAAMDLTNVSLSLSGGVLTATLKVSNLSQLAAVSSAVSGTTQEAFLVRWSMGTGTIYYAEATLFNSATSPPPQFSAGKANSVDLCSVSACRPLVLVYGETPDPVAGQTSETGSVNVSTGTITITVNAADVGSPTSSSLLEEVGGYAYTASHAQTGTTNLQAQVDNVPLEIDGICCFNFEADNLQANIPETPWAPALIGMGAALVGVGVIRRRFARRNAIDHQLN